MTALFRTVLFCSLITTPATVRAQNPVAPTPTVAKTDLPLRLDLSRRDLKNFLTDKTALAPFTSSDAATLDLRDVFTLGSVNTPYAVFWDPLSCRLLGILDLEAPPEVAPPAVAPDNTTADEPPPKPAASPYLFKASGALPLTGTAGVSGLPRYFGFRLVEGRPEFLYTCGSLAVEERLWLEDGGRILRQRFSAKDAARGLQISVPAEWKGRVEASVGTWKGTVLTVPVESVAEVVLGYPLAPAATTPEPAKPDSN